MTDTTGNQLIAVIPGAGDASGISAQLAAVVVGSEVVQAGIVAEFAFVMPTQDIAQGAVISQLAIVSLDREYDIPLHLHGWLIPCIWGNPFFIERDQML